MRPKLLLFCWLAFSTASFASGESASPPTAPSARVPDALILTAGAGLPVPSVGAKLRLFRAVEAGARLGGLPNIWTAEIDANLLIPNPDPEYRALWYGGLEYLYYHEDGSGGRFRIGYLDVICGREQRFTFMPRLRWDLEAGMAFMLFHEFHGGGAPILFPVLPVARAELRYAVF
jgi:hypothetical protein